ncbi:MAG: hypothetical protein JKX73_02520, partial [Flavobacteriales bacterium]|nr:hypothetical protein [Flavobacteriales bacterium]
YKKHKATFKTRILNFGDKALKAYIDGGGDEADELFEFKDIAFHFLDAELLREISTKAIEVYSETSMEETGFSMEEKIDRDLVKIEKTKKDIEEAKTKLKSGTPEELLRLVKDNRKLVKGLDWNLILDISTAFIALPYNEDNDYYIRNAWEMQVVALSHMRELDKAKKSLERYKTIKELTDPDPKKHTKSYRALRSTLSDAKKSIKEAETDVVTIAIYKSRADTYKDNHQFVDEAYTRRAMLDKLELGDEQASLQLYMLLNAYSNMGYFDKARAVAKEMKAKYPENSYTQSVDSMVKYMPQ